MKAPVGFAAGGRALWKSITDVHELDASQLVQLTEACRAKDRLDKLDDLLRGDHDTWMTLRLDPQSVDGTIYELRVTNALVQANATANLMKQLLAALRLPDEATGKKPQYRGARGVQKPSVPKGVSSLDRARAARSS